MNSTNPITTTPIKRICPFLFYAVFTISLFIGCTKKEKDSQIDLKLDTTSVFLKPDSSTEVLILKGNGTYTATSSNDSIVTTQISGDTITISAGDQYANANAFVVVSDKYFNREIISVTISSHNELTLSKDSILLSKQQARDTFKILTGNKPYNVSITDTSIAKLSIQGNQVYVTGKKNGKTIVNITDAVGKTSSLDLQVNGPRYAMNMGTSYFAYANFGDIALVDKSITKLKQATFEITCKINSYRGLQTLLGLEINLILRGKNDDYKSTHPIEIAGLHDAIMLHSSSDLPLHQWVHIALVLDCNQTDIHQKYKLYLNGIQDSLIVDKNEDSHSYLNLASSNDGNRFEIGRAAGQDFRALRGEVAEARVWTVARTEEQIKENQCTLNTNDAQGLLARWIFSAGTETYHIQDISGGKYETNLYLSEINNGGGYNMTMVPQDVFVDSGCP